LVVLNLKMGWRVIRFGRRKNFVPFITLCSMLRFASVANLCDRYSTPLRAPLRSGG